MKEKIIEMLALQDKLNTNTNDSNWRNWITPNGKIINWKRCIYMELAEAIDSVSWKHWKNIEGWIDYENFKIEMIDIWHFVMSYLLIHWAYEEIANDIMEYVNVKSEIKLPKELTKEINLELDNILLAYEKIMQLALEKNDSIEYRKNLIESFFYWLDEAWIDFNELYNLYIWKNVLNKFRQDNWYKEWTYIKIWNWKEDNVHMQEVLENNSWFDNIYNKLSEIYTQINK